MVDCKHVKVLWERVSNLSGSKHLHLGPIDCKSIILGIRYTDTIINQIILVAKYVIYLCKISNRNPTFAMLKAYLKFI
jgi:hypothetical protein